MRRRGRGQGAVTEALEGLFGSMESGAKVRESLALAYWAGAVGPQAAAATEAETVRDGILFVRTKSSVWSHELTFLKPHILAELNRRIGRPIIKEIIYRAQGVKKSAVVDERIENPSEEDLTLVALSTDEKVALLKELDSLVSIPDEKMRQSITVRVTRDHNLRRWRLDRGWKQCAGCTALHDTDGNLCPICRLCRKPYAQ